MEFHYSKKEQQLSKTFLPLSYHHRDGVVPDSQHQGT